MQEKRRDRLQSVPQLHDIVNHCTSIFFKVLIDLMNVITWVFRKKQKRVTTAVLKIHLQASRVQQSKDQPWKESAADKTAPARVPSLLSIAGAAGGAGPKDAEAGGHPLTHSPGWALSWREVWAGHSHSWRGGSGGKEGVLRTPCSLMRKVWLGWIQSTRVHLRNAEFQLRPLGSPVFLPPHDTTFPRNTFCTDSKSASFVTVILQ